MIPRRLEGSECRCAQCSKPDEPSANVVALAVGRRLKALYAVPPVDPPNSPTLQSIADVLARLK